MENKTYGQKSSKQEKGELAPPFCCRKLTSCSLDIATSSSVLIPKSPVGVGVEGNFADPGTKIEKNNCYTMIRKKVNNLK